MWILLGTVATAAAVLSFSALRDLAVLCAFDARLAWLLPITIDAGAAAGCLVWLKSGDTDGAERSFARSLTWALLASSVGGNAIVHYLTAYQITPPWWLIVAVSAVPPAVLGATVHLAVLVGRKTPDNADPDASPGPPSDAGGDRVTELIEAGAGRRVLARELNISEHAARQLLAGRENGVAR